jgi:prolipoprotein diacylglyceryltransferase
MLGNVAIGIVVGRMWSAGVAPPLIAGLYLVLAGLARFVEESYRGEPQTPIRGGLRLYQWFALLSVVAGAVVMALRTEARAPVLDPSWLALGPGVAVGLATWLAMGVDFPASSRRFARLA